MPVFRPRSWQTATRPRAKSHKTIISLGWLHKKRVRRQTSTSLAACNTQRLSHRSLTKATCSKKPSWASLRSASANSCTSKAPTLSQAATKTFLKCLALCATQKTHSLKASSSLSYRLSKKRRQSPPPSSCVKKTYARILQMCSNDIHRFFRSNQLIKAKIWRSKLKDRASSKKLRR